MVANEVTWRQRLNRFIFFFPFTLLLVHLKKNHLMLFFWFILFGYITEVIAPKYGIPFLFLDPEYLDKVGFMSHLLVGFSCGGFIMAFNISSYIINGYRFPFLATLARPFLKYCINNAIIPVSFLIVYMWNLARFQLRDEFYPVGDVSINMLGFILGNIICIVICFLYFFATNKNLIKLFGKKAHDIPKNKKPNRVDKETPVKAVFYKRQHWSNVFYHDRRWRVETYLSNFFRVSLARRSTHYDKTLLRSVFTQNHINGSLFEIFVLLSILALGFFREIPIFAIPAGATVFLLFSMLLMVFSAIYSWLKGWSSVIFIVLFLFMNYLSQYNSFNYTNYAYGMNYQGEMAPYSNTSIDAINNAANIDADINYHITILDKWLAKQDTTNNKKPKLVFINTSGGGLRSAMWTFHALQYADSSVNGQLLNQAHLITGSSGGMMGAAYLRELHFRKKLPDISNRLGIAKDLLNPVCFSLATNDMFFRLQDFLVGKHQYTKDRGYAFEQQFNLNTGSLLAKSIGDYKEPEANAAIPMMVLMPTIVNDGRSLIISPQPVSFLSMSSFQKPIEEGTLVDGIEFGRFFRDQEPDSLLFTTALRMNATFPYITPIVSLPSNPTIDVMDAGIRDNVGMATTMKYLYALRKWISTNTSGVVIVQTRDKAKDFNVHDKPVRSILESFASPLGSFYTNWPNIQNFDQDRLLQYAENWFDGPIDVVSFELEDKNLDYISLSWHLTSREKNQILQSINQPKNQNALVQLQNLLK